MLNGKDITIYLIFGLIKKTYYKLANTFLNLMNLLVEILMSKLIYLMMQKQLI